MLDAFSPSLLAQNPTYQKYQKQQKLKKLGLQAQGDEISINQVYLSMKDYVKKEVGAFENKSKGLLELDHNATQNFQNSNHNNQGWHTFSNSPQNYRQNNSNYQNSNRYNSYHQNNQKSETQQVQPPRKPLIQLTKNPLLTHELNPIKKILQPSEMLANPEFNPDFGIVSENSINYLQNRISENEKSSSQKSQTSKDSKNSFDLSTFNQTIRSKRNICIKNIKTEKDYHKIQEKLVKQIELSRRSQHFLDLEKTVENKIKFLIDRVLSSNGNNNFPKIADILDDNYINQNLTVEKFLAVTRDIKLKITQQLSNNFDTDLILKKIVRNCLTEDFKKNEMRPVVEQFASHFYPVESENLGIEDYMSSYSQLNQPSQTSQDQVNEKVEVKVEEAEREIPSEKSNINQSPTYESPPESPLSEKYSPRSPEPFNSNSRSRTRSRSRRYSDNMSDKSNYSRSRSREDRYYERESRGKKSKKKDKKKKKKGKKKAKSDSDDDLFNSRLQSFLRIWGWLYKKIGYKTFSFPFIFKNIKTLSLDPQLNQSKDSDSEIVQPDLENISYNETIEANDYTSSSPQKFLKISKLDIISEEKIEETPDNLENQDLSFITELPNSPPQISDDFQNILQNINKSSNLDGNYRIVSKKEEKKKKKKEKKEKKERKKKDKERGRDRGKDRDGSLHRETSRDRFDGRRSRSRSRERERRRNEKSSRENDKRRSRHRSERSDSRKHEYSREKSPKNDRRSNSKKELDNSQPLIFENFDMAMDTTQSSKQLTNNARILHNRPNKLSKFYLHDSQAQQSLTEFNQILSNAEFTELDESANSEVIDFYENETKIQRQQILENFEYDRTHLRSVRILSYLEHQEIAENDKESKLRKESIDELVTNISKDFEIKTENRPDSRKSIISGPITPPLEEGEEVSETGEIDRAKTPEDDGKEFSQESESRPNFIEEEDSYQENHQQYPENMEYVEYDSQNSQTEFAFDNYQDPEYANEMDQYGYYQNYDSVKQKQTDKNIETENYDNYESPAKRARYDDNRDREDLQGSYYSSKFERNSGHRNKKREKYLYKNFGFSNEETLDLTDHEDSKKIDHQTLYENNGKALLSGVAEQLPEILNVCDDVKNWNFEEFLHRNFEEDDTSGTPKPYSNKNDTDAFSSDYGDLLKSYKERTSKNSGDSINKQDDEKIEAPKYENRLSNSLGTSSIIQEIPNVEPEDIALVQNTDNQHDDDNKTSQLIVEHEEENGNYQQQHHHHHHNHHRRSSSYSTSRRSHYQKNYHSNHSNGHNNYHSKERNYHSNKNEHNYRNNYGGKSSKSSYHHQNSNSNYQSSHTDKYNHNKSGSYRTYGKYDKSYDHNTGNSDYGQSSYGHRKPSRRSYHEENSGGQHSRNSGRPEKKPLLSSYEGIEEGQIE